MSFVQPIVPAIWRTKYRFDGELSITDTVLRAARAVFANDPQHLAKCEEAIENGMLLFGGRVIAGAGTGRHVTLYNCFVSPDIEDSMTTELGNNSAGIMDALKVAALTQQMGGGIGMDFSSLRPRNALVKRRMAAASGPLHFMDMWDGMCECIESAGERRGAMMGTLACWHPDVEEFIVAKRQRGRLTNFNVSVLISDAFMKAVETNDEWQLLSRHPRIDGKHVEETINPDGSLTYVYKVMPARELWEKIIRNTYEHAEPGVIFIDRINEMNNLRYCEYLHCTNPCGEQPLPANGNCNLINTVLPQMVSFPFQMQAAFNFQALRAAVAAAIRAGDNVIDVSMFATPEQEKEGKAKRRIGLGVTGLGNTLQQLCLRYGSVEAVEMTRLIMNEQMVTAYRTSVDLARERGPFPAFNRDEYLARPFIKRLPEDVREGIFEHGIRNGVLLTIAPTGTTSIIAGNVSSGIEPTFAWEYDRNVRERGTDGHEDVTRCYRCQDWGWLAYKRHRGLDPEFPIAEFLKKEKLPAYMVTAQELSVNDHLDMQLACQQYIDSSISKTINVPEDYPFDEFKEVYERAYKHGLKGCTTYRPNKTRGSVLSVEKKEEKRPAVSTRPLDLPGSTYKVKWPGTKYAFYVTINDLVCADGVVRPYEIFINSKSVQHKEWIDALTRSISAVFRRVAENKSDSSFIIEELEEVHSPLGGHWVNGRYVPSLVAMIGGVCRTHMSKLGLAEGGETPEASPQDASPQAEEASEDRLCPGCQRPSLRNLEGCLSCTNCSWTNCG